MDLLLHQSPNQSSSSIPATEDTVWADVSPLLDAACGDLRDGELIHGDNFNLYAAMSALESRYKSGRLFPEYRPAASPTFVPALHSNSHRKVVEMRSKATTVRGNMTMMSNLPDLIWILWR
ncbi:hypothetical protein ACFE04_024667 [Oxalis oulophora]